MPRHRLKINLLDGEKRWIQAVFADDLAEGLLKALAVKSPKAQFALFQKQEYHGGPFDSLYDLYTLPLQKYRDQGWERLAMSKYGGNV